MSLADLRDLVIIICGITITLSLVAGTVLAVILYRKVTPILDRWAQTLDGVHGIVTMISEEIVRPLVKATAFALLLRKGLEALGKMGKKEEDGG